MLFLTATCVLFLLFLDIFDFLNCRMMNNLVKKFEVALGAFIQIEKPGFAVFGLLRCDNLTPIGILYDIAFCHFIED